MTFLLLSTTDTVHSDVFAHRCWPTNRLSVDRIKSISYWKNLVRYLAVHWESTCDAAVGVSVLVVISVLCRKPHTSAVGEGIREVTREVPDLNDVVFGRTVQWELIFSPVFLLLPVRKIDTQDVNPLLSKAVDFLQAQPKVPCNKTVPKWILEMNFHAIYSFIIYSCWYLFRIRKSCIMYRFALKENTYFANLQILAHICSMTGQIPLNHRPCAGWQLNRHLQNY